MPEYPEIHTLISTLNKQCLFNNKIVNIKYLDDKVLKNCNQEQFNQFLINRCFTKISQLGKYIIFHLDRDKYLVAHMRMEGKLFFVKSNEPATKFSMLEIYFANKHKLIYEDFRKFGSFTIYQNKDEYLQSKEISKLGLELNDPKLTADYLLKRYKNRNIAIKTCLLDQTIFTGLGNIYADEVLFACRINPLTKAKQITYKQCQNILKQARMIVQKAIKAHGTTVFSYKFAPNHSGSYQKYLQAYGRKNQPCLRCKTLMKKIKVNGRGTTFCPKCQK